jgi:hypothetical protein
VKRTLHVIVAESERSVALRRLIAPQRRIRHAASEQECLDLAYARAADVMVINLDDGAFGDPEFPNRIRTLARGAFPILGVGTRGRIDADAWLRGGATDVLCWEELGTERLDRCLCHWVRHRRMRKRVRAAGRRALRWWCDLVAALDEVRCRLEQSSDALEAQLTLLEELDGPVCDHRQQLVLQARKQLAELNQIATDLDVAARTIQLKGLERRRRQAQRGPNHSEAWLKQPWDAEDAPGGEAPLGNSGDEQRRFGG